MKSKLLLCVGLVASSCNLASYAGALTWTTNQTPQTPGPLVQAPLVESLTTHLNSDSRNSTHPQIYRDLHQRLRYPNFKPLLVPTPPFCCPKKTL